MFETAVILIAAGALLVSVRGLVSSWAWVAGVGGLVFLAGVATLAVATRQAGRAGLMVRRPIVSLGYQMSGPLGAVIALAASSLPPLVMLPATALARRMTSLPARNLCRRTSRSRQFARSTK